MNQLLERQTKKLNYADEGISPTGKQRTNNDRNNAFNTSHVRIPFSGRKLVAEILGKESIEENAENAVGLFTVQEARQFGVSSTVTTKFYELLKTSRRGSLFNKLAQCDFISCPNSMITERAVKHHSFLKTELRSSMSRSTVNQRLLTALNGTGTANYDLRPAVRKFLTTKNRMAQQQSLGSIKTMRLCQSLLSKRKQCVKLYGALFVKILYLTDLAQKLPSLAEIAISACRDVISGRDSYLCMQRCYLCVKRCYLWQR